MLSLGNSFSQDRKRLQESGEVIVWFKKKELKNGSFS